MLCKYGRRGEVEKSLDVANVVEGWLTKLKAVGSTKDVPRKQMDLPEMSKRLVPGKALALGYHALGISQSCWARLTYETTSRSDLQTTAIANFRTALKPVYEEEHNVELLYSLSFMLAETRDLDAAIATVKRALYSESRQPTTNGVVGIETAFDIEQAERSPNGVQRSLLTRCWHLLSLLLSAREDFSTSVASCEAALDLYGGKSNLYGDIKPPNSLEGLDLSEKRAIIEIKITQLALIEVIDGPEAALNSSGELLSLYKKLFKYVEKPPPKVQEPSMSPPPTANGTLRNLRGSILGLPKDQGLRSRKTELSGQTDTTTFTSLHSYGSPDEATRPPTISITGEDGAVPENPSRHSHILSRHVSKKLHKNNSHKAVGSRLSRNASPSRPATSDGPRRHLSLGLPHRNRASEPATVDGPGSTPNPTSSTPYSSDEVGVAISHDLPSIPASPTATSNPPNPLHNIPSTAQNMNHRNPNPHPPPPKPSPPQHYRPTPRDLHPPPPPPPTPRPPLPPRTPLSPRRREPARPNPPHKNLAPNLLPLPPRLHAHRRPRRPRRSHHARPEHRNGNSSPRRQQRSQLFHARLRQPEIQRRTMGRYPLRASRLAHPSRQKRPSERSLRIGPGILSIPSTRHSRSLQHPLGRICRTTLRYLSLSLSSSPPSQTKIYTPPRLHPTTKININIKPHTPPPPRPPPPQTRSQRSCLRLAIRAYEIGSGLGLQRGVVCAGEGV
jgi:hypothetical protein